MSAPQVFRQPMPPWPVVGECFEKHRPAHTCPQHDGSHDHRFVAWFEAPQIGSDSHVVDGFLAPGLPVRCRDCGARKCDMPACSLIRHHGGDHDPY